MSFVILASKFQMLKIKKISFCFSIDKIYNFAALKMK